MKTTTFCAMACVIATLAACDDQPPPKVAPTAAVPASAVQTADVTPSTPASAPETQVSAKPASAAEWRTIQNFVTSVWAIDQKQSLAHDQEMDAMKRAYRHQDIDAIERALQTYQTALDQLGPKIDAIEVPEVSNPETERYMNNALEGLAVSSSLESQKNALLIGQLDGTHAQVPQSDIDDLNRQINAETVKSFHSLCRVYWNYGYQMSDLEEKTFHLKKGARPSPSATFNRE
jgi:hypothetical protein